MSEIKGGQLKQPSGLLYSPLLLLSLYAWPKFNMYVQPISEGGETFIGVQTTCAVG